jgi:hypothetical protein
MRFERGDKVIYTNNNPWDKNKLLLKRPIGTVTVYITSFIRCNWVTPDGEKFEWGVPTSHVKKMKP